MTKEKINELYKLNREAKMWQRELERLQCKSLVKGQEITGMPFVTGTSDRVGELATTMADIEMVIRGILAKIQIQRKNIIEYIEGIEDPELRQILYLRSVSCMNWHQIAKELGAGYSADAVKQRYYRHFKSVTPCH